MNIMAASDEDIVEEEDEVVPQKKRRGPRTTRVQHEQYIAFCMEHPSVLDSLDNNYKSLWKDLVEKLNAIGPQRTVRNWQENLKGWEYQVKSKKRLEIIHTDGTGGGEPKKTLTNLEERALNVFGRVAITGDSLAFSIGLGSPMQSPQKSSAPTSIPSSLPSSSSVPSTTSNDRRPTTTSTALDKLSKNFEGYLKEKRNEDGKNEANFSKVADGIDRLGRGMETMANAMKLFMENLKK